MTEILGQTNTVLDHGKSVTEFDHGEALFFCFPY